MIALNAHAKVNLALEVLGRREDGYHDIVSVLQTIDLHDTLTLEDADTVSLECDTPELGSPQNLALRAAEELRRAAGVSRGVRIVLKKGIPIAAGLGGGSSDAAATLRGLNRLWKVGMSLEDQTGIAVLLGSDVPFFLRGGTAMVQGRGERVHPLPPADLKALLILSPEIRVPGKTARMYSMLSEAGFTRGALTRKLAARIAGGGDVPAQLLFNAFDGVAFDAFPGLEPYWNTLHSLGAREIHLAGSGPSMFAPVSRREMGTAIQLILERVHGWRSYLVGPWRPENERP